MNKEIPLIGKPMPKILEVKLPTVKEVMCVFFHHLNFLKYSVKQSAKNVAGEVIQLWKKNDIPTSGTNNVVQRIIRCHDKWKSLQKNFTRKKSPAQKKKQSVFQNGLKILFDIVDQKSLKLLGNRIKDIYLNQKSGTRKEFIHHNIQTSTISEELMEVEETSPNQPSSSCPTIIASEKSVLLSEQSLSLATNFGSDLSYEPPMPVVKTPKINVLTAELIAVLDRTNVSSRNAMFIITAVLSSVGIKVEETTLSYRTIQRARMIVRKEIAVGLKNDFKSHDKYVIHWDGKLLQDIVGSKSVDRLSVLLTAFGVEQLLGVPKMDSGSAQNQTTAILRTSDEWGLSRYVKAMCFDTTAVNTGIHNGTCVEIEKALGRELIYLPYRHHIYELILRSAFEVYWPTSSGSNVPIFGRFKKKWDEIDKTNYKAGIEDPKVANVVLSKKNEISFFITQCLQLKQPRDDYKEFLELSLIFLGVVPQDKVCFKYPGVIHHARWMAKAIYSLKIFIFRDEFGLTAKELNNLRQICIFTIMVYLKAWFSSTSAIAAPNHDLEFLKQLIEYKEIDASIFSATCEKMTSHLWYLNHELAVLSLFDDAVPLDMKKRIVDAVKTRDSIDSKVKRFEIDRKNINSIIQKDLSDFVSQKSLNLFKIFDLPYDFLDVDIELWASDESYKENQEYFKQLKVVNDVAERGVALVSEYNQCLTKNEHQFQYLLQVVKEHRAKFPNCNKSQF
ncbi:uncharacterized protein LOC123269562 [Cotesia glomerata]|uniref:uncharacterized protein LOC123269562 n=1 Tax=Cotesia glomerata TaxID=32391 RepID=UPI001D007756|nr:uncharacterized protein LOC123269562 [Cotesia glomerata]